MANEVYQSKYTAEQIEQKFDDVGSLKTENSNQNDLMSSLSTNTSELESAANSLSNENSTQNSHLNSLSTENSTQTSEIISLSTAESELSSEIAILGSEVAEKQSNLTAGDNITITNNVIEATGNGALDLSRIIPPGQRTPDQFEVTITDPQEGQVMRYNVTTEQWENGDDYHVYSTSERVVGKWIDGKPIYEKTIDFGALPSSTVKSVNHNISSLNMIIKISAIAWNPSSNIALNIPDAPPSLPIQTYDSTQVMKTNNIRIIVDSSTVKISDEIDRSSYNSYVTIQYTKITDTV